MNPHPKLFSQKELAPIAIFSVTALGYSSAYAYESGFLSAYGVSGDFAQVAIPQILIASLAICLGLLIIDVAYALYRMIANFTVNFNIVRRFALDMVFICASLIMATIVTLHTSDRESQLQLAFATIIIASTLLLLTTLMIFYKNRNKVSWEATIKKVYLWPNSERTTLRLYSHLMIPFFFGATLILGISFFLGFSTPFGKDALPRTFINDHEAHRHLVVREYGDILIIKDVDSKTKKLLPGFSTAETKGKQFSIENTIIYK